MKYKILKKAIRINSYNEDGNVAVSISLLFGRVVKLTSDIILPKTDNTIHENLRVAILMFKNSKEYEDIVESISINEKLADSNLTTEYNSINNISNLKYFDEYYLDITELDYTYGSITRYLAKFLNHNYIVEISIDDYKSILNKENNTHFEAYDVTSVSWKLTGKKQEVFDYNTKVLQSIKNVFGEFQTFYNFGEFESGPFYLTEFDEIPNLYTIGNELIYEEELTGFAGYYHYIKNKLWSGKMNIVGPNDPLIEEITEDSGDSTVGLDIVNDVQDAIQKITDELNNLESALANANSDISNAMSGFEKNLNDDISNLLGGSDLKDIFTESFADALAIQNDPNMQAEIEKKYEDRANSEIDKLDLSKSDKDKLKKKKTKMPKIKIPNFHIGRPPHPEGTDHNSEVGF